MRLPAARCLVVTVLVFPTGLEPAAGETPGIFARPAKRDVVPSRTLLTPSLDGRLRNREHRTARGRLSRAGPELVTGERLIPPVILDGAGEFERHRRRRFAAPLPDNARVARAATRVRSGRCRLRTREDAEVDTCLEDDEAHLVSLLQLVPAEVRPGRANVFRVYPSDPAFRPEVRAKLMSVEAFAAAERPGDVIINAEGRLWLLSKESSFAAAAMAATSVHEFAHASRGADERQAREVEARVFAELAKLNRFPQDAVRQWIGAIRSAPEVTFTTGDELLDTTAAPAGHSASFRRHYQRIGWVVTPGHYETARAKQATADIRRELTSARRPPMSGAPDLRPTDVLVRREMPFVPEPVGETTDRDPQGRQLLLGTRGREPAETEAERIARALGLLKAHERPRAPIRFIDPDPVRFPVFRVAPQTAAIADFDSHTLWLNPHAPEVTGDIELLAALLAHEGQHFESRAHDGARAHDEVPAYRRQLQVLRRLRYENRPYMQALKQRADGCARQTGDARSLETREEASPRQPSAR
jgi:hypothetical protein